MKKTKLKTLTKKEIKFIDKCFRVFAGKDKKDVIL